MKQIITALLVLAIMLSACACGTSSAVKNAREAITAIGTVTLDSLNDIEYAEKLFNILTDNEKEKIDNRIDLVNAREEYEALVANQPEVKFNTALNSGDYVEAQNILNENPDIENFDELQDTIAYETMILACYNNVKPQIKSPENLTISEVRFAPSTGSYPLITFHCSGENGFGGYSTSYIAFSGKDLAVLAGCSSLNKSSLSSSELVSWAIVNTMWSSGTLVVPFDLNRINSVKNESSTKYQASLYTRSTMKNPVFAS